MKETIKKLIGAYNQLDQLGTHLEDVSNFHKAMSEFIEAASVKLGVDEGWTGTKPNEPCLFVTKDVWKGVPIYKLFTLERADAIGDNEHYLALYNEDGCEWGALEDLESESYMIIVKL